VFLRLYLVEGDVSLLAGTKRGEQAAEKAALSRSWEGATEIACFLRRRPASSSRVPPAERVLRLR